MEAETRFRAMGSDAHLVVVGGRPGLLDEGRRRVDELEGRWSRFIPDSEVSRLTRNAGAPVLVSDDTVLLVRRAIEAWRMTGGSFDPTVLGAVIRAGYDRTYEALGSSPPRQGPLLAGCIDIEVVGRSVRLPARTGFDPGGIGKGLAADLVTAELLAAGADGALVNLGGDLRVVGESPVGGGWTIALEHPQAERPIALVGIRDGGVATSTTLLRTWTVDGVDRQHLIDPATGEPTASDVSLASVVAASAWQAEVLAKSVLLRGSAHPFDVIDGEGAEAVAVTDAGDVLTSSGFDAFLGDTRAPEVIR